MSSVLEVDEGAGWHANLTIWVIYFLCTLYFTARHMASRVLSTNSYAFMGRDPLRNAAPSRDCTVLVQHFINSRMTTYDSSRFAIHITHDPIRCLRLNVRLVYFWA